MKFIMNLWPPAEKFFDEITKDLSKSYDIIDIKDFEIKDKDEFKSVIRKIYLIDGAREETIKLKIDRFANQVRENGYIQRRIAFEIPKPNFRPRGDGKPICIQTEELKKKYRSGYKDKIHNYVYDVIIHIGDNFKQTCELEHLFSKLNGKSVEC